MKYLRYAGVVLGVTLVAVMLRQTGWTSIRHTLGLLGWGYAVVLAYPLTWIVLNAIGWRFACIPSIKIPLWRLTAIRLAGETFNSLLPSGYVGGEPVKIDLFSRYTSVREATSSVLIGKSAQSIGLLFYIGLGLVLGIPAHAGHGLKSKTWIALGLLTVGVGIFTVLLANQSFSRLGRALHRLTGLHWFQTQQSRLAALDDSLGTFYREYKGRFAASVGWHGAGWMAGMSELAVIAYLLGTPFSWRQAWFMGALAQLGSVIGLISPAGLGFYEGGHYMAAVLLGLPPSLGVSMSLIRRVREVFWDGVGLFFFWDYSRQTAKAKDRK